MRLPRVSQGFSMHVLVKSRQQVKIGVLCTGLTRLEPVDDVVKDILHIVERALARGQW